VAGANEPNTAQSAHLEWLDGLRERAYEYLAGLGIWKVRIPDEPEWHLEPYLCVWSVEDRQAPGQGGWWVLCGGLPTDSIRTDYVRSARDALHAIGARWLDAAEGMRRGQARPVTWTGLEEGTPELAVLLENRGAFLVSWAGDDSCWEPEYAPA
jgi:hypothetical protein